MKRVFVGLIILASTFSAFGQSCGQARALIKVRAEVGKISQIFNPVNSSVLDSSGELKDVLLSFQNSSFISEIFNSSIDDLDENKVNAESLGADLTNYVSKSLKECIKADELLQIVDSLEKISKSSPHYRNFANKVVEELATQEHYLVVITKDIAKIESGTATGEEISSFLERYMGASLEIAIYHANDYLLDIKKDVSALLGLSKKLDSNRIDKDFENAKASIAIAIEKTFEAIEVSGI